MLQKKKLPGDSDVRHWMKTSKWIGFKCVGDYRERTKETQSVLNYKRLICCCFLSSCFSLSLARAHSHQRNDKMVIYTLQLNDTTRERKKPSGWFRFAAGENWESEIKKKILSRKCRISIGGWNRLKNEWNERKSMKINKFFWFFIHFRLFRFFDFCSVSWRNFFSLFNISING